ncbi:MAG: SusC/RagA family TonB-linked outer membrane protein, partial [Bacteroidetes bacterium]|nr:SusC/RagA family TonB-linked outer membrane protein [Bacteroidota bacterium]
MKKSLLLLLAFTFYGLLSYGQNVTIKGQVTTSDQLGLPGVTVVEKGTTNGTVANVDGNYEITVGSADAVLAFSFIGFTTQEIAIAGKSTIDVLLEEDTQDIDEIVVVGFGTQKKENVTGATSYVKMDDIIGDRPIVNSAQALQGVSAGLQVVSTSGQPGSTGTSINIRGFTSINGGSPLVLVDNVPMSLSDVNPRDIEAVSVLKDAAASSIYGARAAFGVVLITTKKAKKNQPIKFEYSTTLSFDTPTEIPEKASTREFVEALDDWGVFRYFENQQVSKWLNYLDQYDANPSQLTYLKDPVSNTNYPIVLDPESGIYYPLSESNVIGDLLDNAGISTIHNLTMSGGSERISYRINAGYAYEDGILTTDNDSYKNYNVNAFMGADLTSNLKSSTNIFYRSSVRTNPIGSYGSALGSTMYAPIGFFELPNGDILPFDTAGNKERYRIPSTTDTDNLRMFQKLEYTLLKDFTITGEYTYQKGMTTTRDVNEQARFASAFKFVENNSDPTNTQYSRGYSDFINHALNIYTKYNKSIGQHNFGLMAGFNKENRISEGFSINRKNLISVGTPGIDTALGEYGGGDSYRDWAVMGYFGHIDYNYKEKYFIEANGRYDGSSRFAKGSRFGFFPSFSGGWNIARESFMESVEQISSLKLRGSWGEIGNQNTNDLYPTIPGYTTPEAKWIDLG